MKMMKLLESIFNYKDIDGSNCLIDSFRMIGAYASETGNRPDSSLPMFNEIESTIFYLIKLAEDNNLNMDKILNSVTANGKTLFWHVAFFSEPLALELLSRKVDVKIVDHFFQTSSFRVS